MYPLRYLARVVIFGLLSAQAVAVLQVYLSNADLYHTVMLLDRAGYLTIPGHLIVDSLHELKPAFIGGLFLTFSIGAGLTLLTLGTTLCWDRIYSRNRAFGVLGISIWLLCLVYTNLEGFNPVTSLYLLVVPLVTFWSTLKWLCPSATRTRRHGSWVHIVPVLILAALWGSQWRPSMFLDIRDNLLLTNRAGTWLSDTYYRYTLYPARVLKTLDQKMLKTCRIERFPDPSLERSVAGLLRTHDYLQIDGSESVDLMVTKQGNRLVFHRGKKALLEVPLRQFASDPRKALRSFSERADTGGFSRQITYYGLLIGFPLVLYILIHSAVRLLVSRLSADRKASILSTGACFLIGLSLLALFHTGKSTVVDKGRISENLTSARWQDQVSGLKALAGNRTDIGSLGSYAMLADSPHVPVRYWLANALAFGRGKGVLETIVGLLDDPSPNVACLAFRALGRRGDKAHIGTILNRIETSDHWYVQWYAYSALKALGWKQKRST